MFPVSTMGKDKVFSLAKRKLTNVTPNHLIELIAINDKRDTTFHINPFELKKHKDHYSYKFNSYNGDGVNLRFGKISLSGEVKERSIDYAYCSHSMGKKGKCYFSQLKEVLKSKTYKGTCRITEGAGGKVISHIQITDKSTLNKARKICKDQMLTFLVPKKIKVSLLKPYKISN